MRFQLGEQVYVPRGRVGLAPHGMSTFYRGPVVDRARCKIKVDLPGAATSDWVATSFAKRVIKAAVITFGDFRSERLVFDPLAKNILYHLRLLLGPEEAIGIKVRSVDELVRFWASEQAEISHVIFVGHGDGANVQLIVDGWVSGVDLSARLRVHGAPRKHFLSLCCKSGQQSFAKPFSSAAICEDLVAPFQSVHGAVAAQFCSTYFLFQYFGGMTSKPAFTKSKAALIKGASFRFWDNGSMR